jgi:hypothetical protein
LDEVHQSYPLLEDAWDAENKIKKCITLGAHQQQHWNSLIINKHSRIVFLFIDCSDVSNWLDSLIAPTGLRHGGYGLDKGLNGHGKKKWLLDTPYGTNKRVCNM